MRRIFLVSGIVILCLVVQLVFARVLGSSFVPNFVLIAVVFFNLYRGLRYSLGAAFLGGFLLDSFSGSPMGFNVFSLVMCAFILGSVKKFIYQPGVAESRLLMVFLTVISNSFLQYFVNVAAGIRINFTVVLWGAMVPEIVLTLVFALYTLERLKKCASKLYS